MKEKWTTLIAGILLGAFACMCSAWNNDGFLLTKEVIKEVPVEVEVIKEVPTDTIVEVPVEINPYTVITLQELNDELKANPIRAENTYLGMLVEVTGTISSISTADSLKIISDNHRWGLFFSDNDDAINCKFGYSPKLKQMIMKYNTKDTITVRGIITDLGGYYGAELILTEIVENN